MRVDSCQSMHEAMNMASCTCSPRSSQSNPTTWYLDADFFRVKCTMLIDWVWTDRLRLS